MSYVKRINGYDIKDEEARIQLEEDKEEIENLNSVLKFHSVANSSSTYITEFPNGKNLIIDTGVSTQWSDIKEAIDNLGITKFDYMIVTHFHNDHIGNLQNLLNTYDFSECICWVGMKPDYTNHSEDITDLETTYDEVIALLEAYNLNPTVPINDSYYEIDNNTKLHFLNTSSEIAEDYYNVITEYQTTPGVNFNHFSLITEIIHKDVRILSLGDIEKIVEEKYTSYLSKCHLLLMPHHGVNRDIYKPFYYTTIPDYALSSYITSDNDEWITTAHKSFMFLKSLNSKIISAYSSKDINGLFTFISNGKVINTTVLDSGIWENFMEEAKLYSHIAELINFTEKNATSTTLADIFNNMNRGSSLTQTWWTAYNTNYEAIYNELRSIFPDFTAGMRVEFQKGYTTYKRIKVYGDRVEYTAESLYDNISWIVKGEGLLANVSGQANLLSLLDTLPVGHYYMPNYTADGDVLEHQGYALSIDILSKWTQNNALQTNANISGLLRYTGAETTDIARVVFGYLNTVSNPKLIWYKFNNYVESE